VSAMPSNGSTGEDAGSHGAIATLRSLLTADETLEAWADGASVVRVDAPASLHCGDERPLHFADATAVGRL